MKHFRREWIQLIEKSKWKDRRWGGWILPESLSAVPAHRSSVPRLSNPNWKVNKRTPLQILSFQPLPPLSLFFLFFKIKLIFLLLTLFPVQTKKQASGWVGVREGGKREGRGARLVFICQFIAIAAVTIPSPSHAVIYRFLSQDYQQQPEQMY